MWRGCSIENMNFPKCTGTSDYQGRGMLTASKTVLLGGVVAFSSGWTDTFATTLLALILTNTVQATLTDYRTVTSINNATNGHTYVPSSLLSSYQSATNWVSVHQAKTDGQGNYNGIQDIESNINTLREWGADFSYTPYANKKWENNQLVTDSTIGEEVDS
jgi:hypothetical protein